MPTVKTTNVSITSSNLTGQASVSFDEVSKKRTGTIALRWQGASLTFTSVSDYEMFLSELVLPLTNALHGPDGDGYVAASAGTASTTKVLD